MNNDQGCRAALQILEAHNKVECRGTVMYHNIIILEADPDTTYRFKAWAISDSEALAAAYDTSPCLFANDEYKFPSDRDLDYYSCSIIQGDIGDCWPSGSGEGP